MDDKPKLDFWDRTFGTSPYSQTAKWSLGSVTAAYLLGMLARYGKHLKDQGKPYVGVDVRSAVDASIPDPVVSAEDIKELSGEAELSKSSGFIGDSWESIKDWFSKGLSSTKNLATGEGFDWRNLGKYAIPAGLGIGGFALGAKQLDDYYDDKLNEELKAKKKKLEALHKKVILARAMNARGILDQGAYDKLMQDVEESKGLTKKSFHKEALDIEAWLGAGMAAAFALSALGTYAVTSKRSEANRKYEAMKGGMRQYSLGQRNVKPLVQDLVKDQAAMDALVRLGTTNKPQQVQETPALPVSITI